jgi:hypothetical protein
VPARSAMFAVLTKSVCGKPFVSTPICIFMPEVFFPHHNPFLRPCQRF